MIDIGIHHPFDFVEEERLIEGTIVYDLSSISIKITANVTQALLINVANGNQNFMVVTPHSHTIGDNTVLSTFITGAKELHL